MYVIIDDVEGRQLTPVQSLRLRNAALMYAVLWWDCKTRLPSDAKSMRRYSEALVSCGHDGSFNDSLSGYQVIKQSFGRVCLSRLSGSVLSCG